MGGATVIKQSRVTKARNDLKNYSTYMQDMFYANPEYASTGIEDGDVVADVNEYLTEDIQFGDEKASALKDAWGNAYTLEYGKVTGEAKAAVLIWSNGSNQTSESSLSGITATISGDDIAVLIKMVDGAVTVDQIDGDKSNTNQTPTPTPEVKLASIEIITTPTKTGYNIGNDFDKSGMVVKAHFSNNTEKEITDYIITNGTGMQNTQTSVTIAYTEDGVTKTAEQPITVSLNATVTSGVIQNSFAELQKISTKIASDNTINSTSKTAYGLTAGDAFSFG